MSMIACICVHQCDLCRRIAVLKTEDDNVSFEAEWYNGWGRDYCPDCRDTAAVQQWIIQDEEWDRSLKSALAKYRTTEVL